MKNRSTIISILVALLAGMATTSTVMAASIADSVPLLPGGVRARHLYTVPGFSAGALAIVISCTSTEKTGGKDVTWAVQFYNANPAGPDLKNDVTAGEGVVTAVPGRNMAVSNVAVAGFGVIAVTGGGIGPGTARILSTSRNLICAAYLIDPTNSPPTSITALPILSRTRQKGQ